MLSKLPALIPRLGEPIFVRRPWPGRVSPTGCAAYADRGNWLVLTGEASRWLHEAHPRAPGRLHLTNACASALADFPRNLCGIRRSKQGHFDASLCSEMAA